MTVDSFRYSAYDSTAIQPRVHACPDIGNGWFSLYDVILKSGTYFLSIYRLLVLLEEVLRPRPATGQTVGVALGSISIPPDTRRIETLKQDLALFSSEDLRGMGLSRTESRLKRIHQYIESNHERLATYLDFVGDERLQIELRTLREALMDDLEERTIFIPDFEKFDRWFMKRSDHFPQEVREAFPEAERDMQAAAQCYVTDNDTASVFHSMRIAECGLRGLAKRIAPKLKPDKLEWGAIVRELRRKIEDLHQPGKRQITPQREKRLDFYSGALDQCVYFKGIRDDAAHGRGQYEAADALKALTHVEEFMKLLAKNGVKLIPKLAG